MTRSLTFRRLNEGWNADPNAPDPHVIDVLERLEVNLLFEVNFLFYKAFRPFDLGILRFSGCRRWRLGETNDTGWSRGQCRYSKLAPDWGEFYELVGHDPLRDLPDDWHEMAALDGTERHFLFYLRDETFECLAVDWSFAPHEKNALITRLAGTEGP